MAFQTNFTGSRMPNPRTYLEGVQRIMRACGQDAPTSITGDAAQHVQRARQSVDDSIQRVWNACLWDFRGVWGWLLLENETMWYPLPGDWQARKTDLLPTIDRDGGGGTPNTVNKMRFLDYDRFIGYCPEASIPRDDQISEPGLSHSIRWARVKEQHFGIPQIFTIYGGFLGVYPMPSDTIDTNEFNIVVPWLVAYWSRLKDLDLNDDEIPLPPNLLVPQHNLALAYYKQSMEYGDFQADEARGERLLNVEVAKSLQVAGNTQHNQTSEEYGRL